MTCAGQAAHWIDAPRLLLKAGQGILRLLGSVRITAPRLSRNLIVFAGLSRIAEGFIRPGQIKLRLGVGWAGANGILIVSHRMGEIRGRKALAPFARGFVRDALIACARRRGRGATSGVLRLQCGHFLLKLIQFGLLLRELSLVGFDLITRASGNQYCGEYRIRSQGARSHLAAN